MRSKLGYLNNLNKYTFSILFISLITGIIISLLSISNISDIWEKPLGYDSTLRFNTVSPHPSIKIIAIDDESLATLGTFPWSRDYYAQLLDILTTPKVIGFDIILNEYSREKTELEFDNKLSKSIRKNGKVVLPVVEESNKKNISLGFPLSIFMNNASIGFAMVYPDSDGKLRSIQREIYPNSGYFIITKEFLKNLEKQNFEKNIIDSLHRIINKKFYTKYELPENIPDEKKDLILKECPNSFKYYNLDPTSGYFKITEETLIELEKQGVEKNIIKILKPILNKKFYTKQNLKKTLPKNIPTTRQEIILKQNLSFYKYYNVFGQTHEFPQKLYSFDQIIAEKYLGKKLDLPEIIYPNYQQRGTFPQYSFYKVLFGEVLPEKFNNSIVLIGATAEGMDRVTTPLGLLPGIEHHAQTISSILQGNYLRIVNKQWNVIIIILLSLFIGLIYLSKSGVLTRTLIVLSIILFSLVFHYLSFIFFKISFEIVNINLTIISCYLFLILWVQFKTSRSLKNETIKLINKYNNRKLKYNLIKSINFDVKKNFLPYDITTSHIVTLSEIGQALDLERDFLQTLIQNINHGILVTDNKGKILLSNPVSEKLFNNHHLIGKEIIEIMTVFPDIREPVKNLYNQDIQKNYVFQTELGANVYKFTFLYTNNESVGYGGLICLIEDITDLHKQAYTDGLTGLWNHKYFKEQLNKEIQKANRYYESYYLSILISDIDHFKSFNDTYGHQTGDIVLQTIAKTFQSELRSSDLVARYGGEEFVAILPMTKDESAKIAAERVRKKVESLKLKDLDGKDIRQVTVSIGIAQFIRFESIDDFIKRADDTLYLCKKSGRNCVKIYSSII